MTTLSASAKRENLKRSFDVFIATQFAAVFVAPNAGIKYAGTVNQLDETNLREWIEPFVIGPVRPDAGDGRYLTAKTDRLWRVIPIFQVNIFSRPRRQTVAHRLDALRDLVVEKMYPGKTIPMADYASGLNTNLGQVVLRTVSMDQQIPTSESQQDLEQWTYSINGHWIEHANLS